MRPINNINATWAGDSLSLVNMRQSVYLNFLLSDICNSDIPEYQLPQVPSRSFTSLEKGYVMVWKTSLAVLCKTASAWLVANGDCQFYPQLCQGFLLCHYYCAFVSGSNSSFSCSYRLRIPYQQIYQDWQQDTHKNKAVFQLCKCQMPTPMERDSADYNELHIRTSNFFY